MHPSTSLRWLVVAVSAAMLLMVAAACSAETVEVPGQTVVVEKVVTETVEVPGETVVVEKEVIKTVEVPGETVTKEVVKTVEVPGQTVVVEKEVVKTVEVPGQTVVVEKEVVKTVEVPGQTVVVEKEVVKEVMVPGETVVKEVVVIATPVPAAPSAEDMVQAGSAIILTPTLGHERFDTVNGVGAAGYLEMVHAWLMGLDAVDGGLKISPGIAERWELSPDGTTWTFTIRNGAKFHDGTDLTAADVA